MTDIIEGTDGIEGLPPCLTVDLVRVILEWLFDMHQKHRKTSRRELLTLSKQVKSWLEPLLYRRILITHNLTPEYTARISRALKEPRLAASMRTIFMDTLSAPSISLLQDVLRASDGIHRLIVYDWVALGDNTDDSAGIWRTKVPSLRQLSLFVHEEPEIIPIIPIFQSLTNLFIGFEGSPSDEMAQLRSILHPIRSLETLTHLALYTLRSYNLALDHIRSHLPSSVKTVILNSRESDGMTISIDWLLKACDQRLVFVLFNDSDDEKRASGLFVDGRSIEVIFEGNGNPPPLDMWDLADLALERRREMQADMQIEGQGL